MNNFGLLGFWLKTISYGDDPRVVVIWDLYASGNNFTSVDHSVYFLKSPFIIQRRYSCNERFMPSTSPGVHGGGGGGAGKLMA